MLVVVADQIPAFVDIDDPFGDVVRERGHDIRYESCTTEDEVIERAADADVMIVSKSPITPRVAKELSAEIIIRVGTGYDNVNVQAASDNDIMVSNTPGYSKQQVATHAITLMLATAREVVAADNALRRNDWMNDGPNRQCYDRVLGIVGLGRIGRAVVPKARGLDMEVIAYDPYVPEDVFTYLDIEKVTFDGLLDRADAVTVHTPLTAETRHLFSDAEFDRMKDDAILVNVARGPIIEEAALVRALEDEKIWGAGLDVFEREPPEDSPLFEFDRMVCSPHRAGKTDDAHETKLRTARQVLIDALEGNHPQYLVNPEVLQYSDEQLNPEYHRWN